jgi:hypothetical protein
MSRLLCQAELHRLGRHIRRASRPAAYWLRAVHDNDLTATKILTASASPAGPSSPFTESNRRPSPYHGDALPTELKGRCSRGSHVTRWRPGCGKQVRVDSDPLVWVFPPAVPALLPSMAPYAQRAAKGRPGSSRVAVGQPEKRWASVVRADSRRAGGFSLVPGRSWIRAAQQGKTPVRHAEDRAGLEVAALLGGPGHPLVRETSRHSD